MILFKYTAVELRNIDSHALPNCIEVIKSLRLLRRPPYVHRAARHKFVYQDTILAVPTVRVHASLRRRHRLWPRPLPAYLSPLVCVVDSTVSAMAVPRCATFLLLNVRSLNNKAFLINDIILERALDFLCLIGRVAESTGIHSTQSSHSLWILLYPKAPQ